MLYMLAAGMVMGPAGFGGKHYFDSLAVFPGHIPLFRDNNKGRQYIPAAALQHAVSEYRHLRPCIASFELEELYGSGFRLSNNGGFRKVKSPRDRRLPNDIAHLVPAPLPMSLLQRITFRSSEDRHVFETAAGDVANVMLPDGIINVDDSLFRTTSDIAWPPPKKDDLFSKSGTPDCHDEYPHYGQAIGGVLAMLYHAANRSDLGLAVFRHATNPVNTDDTEALSESPVLREFDTWFRDEPLSDKAHAYAELYWGVVDALIRAPNQTPQKSPIDSALTYLEDARSKMRKYKDALAQLISDMRGCLGLGDGTISTLFDRHRGALSRSLLLFCLRDRSRDLLDFTHPMLEDEDYVLACLLFGARDGWIGLPRELRDPALADYVSYRMTVHEHRRRDSGLDFKSRPTPPVPLRAYFSTSGGGWSRKQETEALKLADICGWDDCIQTHITARTANVLDVIENTPSHITLKGRVLNTEHVDSKSFLQHLGRWPLVPFQMQTEIRSAFECDEDAGAQDDEGGRR